VKPERSHTNPVLAVVSITCDPQLLETYRRCLPDERCWYLRDIVHKENLDVTEARTWLEQAHEPIVQARFDQADPISEDFNLLYAAVKLEPSILVILHEMSFERARLFMKEHQILAPILQGVPTVYPHMPAEDQQSAIARMRVLNIIFEDSSIFSHRLILSSEEADTKQIRQIIADLRSLCRGPRVFHSAFWYSLWSLAHSIVRQLFFRTH